jgi:hypothetical protein
MKLYPSKADCCDADITRETAVMYVHPLIFPNRRAKQIHHYRERDEAHFWHWSDQDVVRI